MTDAGPQWKVVSATPTISRDPSGQAVNGWNVTYQLAGGATGQVFVARTMSDMDAVKAAIAADAETLHNITSLTSG